MDNIDRMILENIQKQKRKKRTTTLILVALVAVVIVVFAIIPTPDKKTEVYNPDVSFDAERLAMSLAKQQLKNPETAEFENMNVSKRGQIYTCTGKIIGQNNFGVRQSAQYRFVLKYLPTSKPSEVLAEGNWEIIESQVK